MATNHVVLVADDNPDLLALLESRLVRRGYTVVTATNGKEALDAAWKSHPDVIVLDWMMPLVPGSEVCAELKDSPRTEMIPVILLTSKSTEHDVSSGFAFGADEFITKPFDFDEVERTIQRLIAEHPVPRRAGDAKKPPRRGPTRPTRRL